MDINGFDYNALRAFNPKFSMSQTRDPSTTKVKPKTFSMTQGGPLIQNPKISLTYKKPEALAIPDASRRSVSSFKAQQRTHAEGSCTNRLSAPLFLSDVQEPLKAPVNILQDRDVEQGEAQGEHCDSFFREYRSEDNYRGRVITVAGLIQI